MSDRTQYILWFSVGTFLGTLSLIVFTIWIIRLLHRRGESVLPTATADVLKAIEGMRQQNSAEHAAFQWEQRAHGGALRKLLNRFGFLKGGSE